MSQILSSGQKVRGDVSQQDCTVEQLLGEVVRAKSTEPVLPANGWR